MGIIYKITNPTGRIYIGKTLNLRKRINCHKHASKKSSTSIMLHNSIRKYGWDAHKLDVIEEIDNDLLNEREIFWIKELNTYRENNTNGMNMTLGGEGNKGSWMDRLDLREQSSKRFSGEGNPFYGKKHTDEVKAELSKIAKERNKLNGRTIPQWGAEKGRLKVIKPVVCYNVKGVFIAEFVSLAEAAKLLKINHSSISESIRESKWIYGKYIFKYKTENYPLKINEGVAILQNIKRAVLYIKGGKIIKEYPSALEASIDLNIPKTTINRASMYNNMRPIRTGHIFIYKDLYETMRQEALN